MIPKELDFSIEALLGGRAKFYFLLRAQKSVPNRGRGGVVGRGGGTNQ